MIGPNSVLNNKRPIEFDNYNIYRKDDSPGKWGVAILVRTDIPQSEIKIKTSLEQISIKIFYKGKYISVTSLYLPNQIHFRKEQLINLNNQLLHNKIILGDINSHHSLWGSRRSCPRGRTIVKFLAETNLVTLNKEDPTYISPTGHQSNINLSIVSPQLVIDAEWQAHSDSLGSDHLPNLI